MRSSVLPALSPTGAAPDLSWSRNMNYHVAPLFCRPWTLNGIWARLNGRPLALLDSMEITRQRTGAATAVAARYLARPDSATATICGCGEQGRIQLIGLRHVLAIRRAFAWDLDPQVSRAY